MNNVLSKNEIITHIRSAQSGKQDAFDVLKKAYVNLIEACVRKRTISGMTSQDVEEMYQEALVHFCNAVCSYDCANKSVEFGLYAKICVENGIVSYLRSYKRQNRDMSVLCDDVDINNLISPDHQDILQSLVDSENMLKLVQAIDSNLSKYERDVWWMYVSGMQPLEISKKIGNVSPKSVSNAIYRIRKKLRECVQHPN